MSEKIINTTIKEGDTIKVGLSKDRTILDFKTVNKKKRKKKVKTIKFSLICNKSLRDYIFLIY